MKLMIPIFHTEFDAKQVSSNRLGEIPPSGDFGGFLWLLWLLSVSGLHQFCGNLPQIIFQLVHDNLP